MRFERLRAFGRFWIPAGVCPVLRYGAGMLVVLVLAACSQQDLTAGVGGAAKNWCKGARDCTVTEDPNR